MGACFDAVSFKACSEKELISLFGSHQGYMRDESGADAYAGHIGIARGLRIMTDKIFKDEMEAHDWVENNVVKGGQALAVKVGDFSKTYPRLASEKKVFANYEKAKQDFENFYPELVKRVKAGKSLQKTCTHCGSKVAVKFIRDANCPVCGSMKFIETPTDTKKYNALKGRLVELEKQVKEDKKKYSDVKAFWFVGALVPS